MGARQMQQLTKAHIVETFNDLLREYPFEKITAKMIIDRAGVSKSTFYRFFLDKHDVLYFNYKNNIDQWVKNQGCKNWKELFVCVYASSLTDHAREKNAFAYNGADSYFQILYRYSYELVEMAALKNRGGGELGRDEKTQLSFFCYGLVSCYADWVRGKFDYTPQEMAEQMYLAMPAAYRNLWWNAR